ncbi:MAG: sulfatase-like hydrolase/transferase [Planctomycetes bacterium]|nr:sulfatase-like hydrolase/transferase [Planctomycetota bacterium]
MKAIVFVLRGCPAGWLGAYGNEWVGTPNLDRFAAESVVFDRHISDRPDPNAASAAWLGIAEPTPQPVLSPSPLGGGVGEGSSVPEPNPPTPFPKKEGGERAGEGLLSALRTANVRTILVRANHPDTDGPEWFYAGFAEVFDARPQAEDNSTLDALIRALPSLLERFAAEANGLLWIEVDGLLPPWDVRQDIFEAYLGRGADEDEEEKYTADEVDEDDEDEDDEEEDDDTEEDEAIEEEEAAVEEEPEPEAVAAESSLPTPSSPLPTVPPWFDPPTGPFDLADPDAWEWLHSTFAAVVTALDAELGVVFDLLQTHGLDKSSTCIVTSDFGYPLGEHGQIGLHRPWLHTELVHLPLIVRLPGAAEACRRVTGFTQPPDLFPTLLDLFGVKPTEGMSLLPLARGEAESVRTQAITAFELNGAAEMSIRTDDCAFVLPMKVPEGEKREPLLFDKPDDRWEVNDMRARKIDLADELERKLREPTG